MKIAKINCKNDIQLKMLIESKWEKVRAETFFAKEPETIEWIESFNYDSIFWDIGANIGIYSLYVASQHYNATVHAFEPMRYNYLRLWQNIFLNNYSNIVAHYVAISKHVGLSSFEHHNEMVGSSGGQVGENGYPIPAHTIDYLASQYGVPDYIKIDTDGNECDIIDGASDTLRHSKLKGVLVEINNNTEKILKTMDAAGFVVDENLMDVKNRITDYNVIFKRKA